MVWFEWFCCKHRIFATYTRWFDVMIKRFGSIYMQDGIISWFTWLYGLWRMVWCHGLYGFVVFVYRIVCYCGLNSFALQTRTLWLDVMVYRVMHCIQDGLNGFALHTGWFNVMAYRVMHCIQDGLNGFALYTGWFNVMVYMVLHYIQDGLMSWFKWFCTIYRMV